MVKVLSSVKGAFVLFVVLLTQLFFLISPAQSQTITLLGSASNTNNMRVPIINDLGDVFYVNDTNFVIGNAATPIARTFGPLSQILAQNNGDLVPCVLSTNGTVTYLNAGSLVQSNLTKLLSITQGGAAAAGFGSSTYKYASPATQNNDFAVSPDDGISFRVGITSNNVNNLKIGVYVASGTNLTLLMDSFHQPPGLSSGHIVDNNGFFHATRNRNGLSLFIGRAYNNAIGDQGYGIWLHDSTNGMRLAEYVSPGLGSDFPGLPGARLTGIEFNIANWPALDDEGRFAFAAQGATTNSPFHNVYGICVGFENNVQSLVTNGSPVNGLPGVTFTNFLGTPALLLGSGGTVTFEGVITGTGISNVNNRVLAIGSSAANVKVLARAGFPAPGLPTNIVFTQSILDNSPTFEANNKYPAGSPLVMFGSNRVAFIGQLTGPGIIASPATNANDSAIFATDDTGNLALIARRGSPMTTASGSVTPTNYFALVGGSGRNGKASGGNRLDQLAFGSGVNTFLINFAPAPLLLNQPAFIGGQWQLTYATVSGKTYNLQSTPTLINPSWADVIGSTQPGDGTTKQFSIVNGGGQLFYRLVQK